MINTFSPLKVGDHVKSNETGREGVVEREVYIGDVVITVYVLINTGARLTRVHLDRIHLDGKPRKRGWNRITPTTKDAL